MQKKRRLALLIAAITCLSAFSVNAAAHAESDLMNLVELTPLSATIDRISGTLTLTGTTASCSAVVMGATGVTEIQGTLTLYRQNGSLWQHVTSWTKSSSNLLLNFSESTAVTKGYNYKLVIAVSAYRNGIWESAEQESTVKYCG
ncbi:MAG: hypothetical protein EOM69_00635 [Clostridia bacterium]|nr:hypothetical protein [Clostridia bacterium]